ncbi:MAG: ectoine/hydroxyectoine ABC transporter permease subunit EhuD [Pseudomonadota bacterium]
MSDFDWQWPFAWEVLPALLAAAVNTVIAALLSFVLALVLGLGLALWRRYLPGAALIGFLAEFIRRTPPLVQIYFLYFVLPETGLVLDALTTGVIALGLHFATYIAEVYRAGIDNVPHGQFDAAAALGLGRWRIMWSVILPQALPPILPALGNYLIIMFKETPLLSAIAVVEMLDEAKIIGSHTFRYTEPITIVGAVFLGLSLASAWAIRRFERRIGRGVALDRAPF